MLDRRQSARDKVIYGGVAEIGRTWRIPRLRRAQHLRKRRPSRIQQRSSGCPKIRCSLTIARKGRSFLAKIIWWRDNFVGVAFSSESPYELPGSDLADGCARASRKKRQLQRRIKELLEG